MAACCRSQVGRRGRPDISAFIVALRESLLWRITTLADQRKPLTQSAGVVVRPGNSATEISAEGRRRRDDDRDDDRRRGLLLLLRWCGSSTLRQERTGVASGASFSIARARLRTSVKRLRRPFSKVVPAIVCFHVIDA
jgi:hypothetical protein